MSFRRHLILTLGALTITLENREIAELRRYYENAPEPVIKPQRPTSYEGAYRSSLKLVWEVQALIPDSSAQRPRLQQLYLRSLKLQEDGGNPAITLTDYTDLLTEEAPLSHTTAPTLAGQPNWTMGNDGFAVKFGVFNVLMTQPIPNRRGVPTLIEFMLKER